MVFETHWNNTSEEHEFRKKKTYIVVIEELLDSRSVFK
jgi:hypothetical protein